MNYLTDLQLGAPIAFVVAVGLIFQDLRLRELPLGFRQCPAEMRGIFMATILQIVSLDYQPYQMLYRHRKCLTDFDLGFMMVSSLRKEVVQSNMGICSDCSFIITREVADS
jgi:hypothetical protein